MQEKVFLGFLAAFATIVILVIFCDLGSSVVSVGQWEGVMFGPSSPLSSRRSRRISPVPRKVSSPSSPSSPSLKRREANAPTVSTISNSKRAPTGPTGLTGPSSSPTSPTSPPSPSPSPSHPSVSTDVPEGPDSPMIVSPVVKKGLEGSNLSTPTSRRDPKTAGILARWQVGCTAQYNELKSQIGLNVFFDSMKRFASAGRGALQRVPSHWPSQSVTVVQVRWRRFSKYLRSINSPVPSWSPDFETFDHLNVLMFSICCEF